MLHAILLSLCYGSQHTLMNADQNLLFYLWNFYCLLPSKRVRYMFKTNNVIEISRWLFVKDFENFYGSRQLNVLKRIGKHLSKLGRLTIYHSYNMSNFNYCPVVCHFCWESCLLPSKRVRYMLKTNNVIEISRWLFVKDFENFYAHHS
jgi:hypothetical protein